jgi:hypothetical protein
VGDGRFRIGEESGPGATEVTPGVRSGRRQPDSQPDQIRIPMMSAARVPRHGDGFRWESQPEDETLFIRQSRWLCSPSAATSMPLKLGRSRHGRSQISHHPQDSQLFLLDGRVSYADRRVAAGERSNVRLFRWHHRDTASVAKWTHLKRHCRTSWHHGRQFKLATE